MKLYEIVNDEYDDYHHDLEVTDDDKFSDFGEWIAKEYGALKNNTVDSVYIHHNDYLENYKGGPLIINTKFVIEECSNFKQLGVQLKHVGTHMTFNNCNDLISLAGCPSKIGGTFSVMEANFLTSLKGMPKSLGSDNSIDYGKNNNCCFIAGCTNLNSIKELWDVNTHGRKIYCFNNDDYREAVNVLNFHKERGTKNFLELIRDARSNGCEDYFK